MKIKFNLYERVAGLFVLAAIFGTLMIAVGVAIKRGWFEQKVAYRTTFPTADGLHAGTPVQVAGLRAGQVDTIELKSSNEIVVTFLVSKKFAERVRGDSVVRVIRPFVIGEKALELTVGSDQAPLVEEGSLIASQQNMDLLDFFSGGKMGPYLATLTELLDEVAPLVKNTGSITKQVAGILQEANKKNQLTRTISNLASITTELNKVIPQLTQSAPELGHDLGKISHNIALLTDEVQKALPAISEMAPEFPRVSRRAIEALDETVITLKAMQKSFLLRRSVKDVKEEEAQRVPASDAFSK